MSESQKLGHHDECRAKPAVSVLSSLPTEPKANLYGDPKSSSECERSSQPTAGFWDRPLASLNLEPSASSSCAGSPIPRGDLSSSIAIRRIEPIVRLPPCPTPKQSPKVTKPLTADRQEAGKSCESAPKCDHDVGEQHTKRHRVSHFDYPSPPFDAGDPGPIKNETSSSETSPSDMVDKKVKALLESMTAATAGTRVYVFNSPSTGLSGTAISRASSNDKAIEELPCKPEDLRIYGSVPALATHANKVLDLVHAELGHLTVECKRCIFRIRHWYQVPPEEVHNAVKRWDSFLRSGARCVKGEVFHPIVDSASRTMSKLANVSVAEEQALEKKDWTRYYATRNERYRIWLSAWQ